MPIFCKQVPKKLTNTCKFLRPEGKELYVDKAVS